MARYDDEDRGIIQREIVDVPSLSTLGSPTRYAERREQVIIPQKPPSPDRPHGLVEGFTSAMRTLGGAVEGIRTTGRQVFGMEPKVPTDDLTQSIVNRVVGREGDYPTRGVERIEPGIGRFSPQPTPVVPPTSLESVWGITRETLPEGGTRYTLPEGQGVMTVSPTGGDDEAARRGVIERARARQADMERGVATEYENLARLREEAIQRQRATEAGEALQFRKDLGLEPDTPQWRRTEGLTRKGRAAVEAARIGVIGDLEKARAAAGGAEAAARVKAQTEAAKLGLQAADLKSKIQYRQAMMDKMAAETGLLEPMKLQLQGARDATERAKIQQEAYSLASKKIYDNALKVLQDRFNMGQIDDATYNTQFQQLTQEFARQQEDIKDLYPIEGRIHSTIPAVWRGGKWVKIPKREAE